MSKKLERNDPCWCGSGKKYKNCHMRFDEKIHGFELEGHIVPGHDIIKTPEQIEGFRKRVDEVYEGEVKQHSSLETEICRLREANLRCPRRPTT